MSTFTPVSIEDMKTLFSHEHGWEGDIINHEYVFDYEIKNMPGIIVRVWTSVNSQGNGRDKGKDAIRVCAVDTWVNKGLRKTPHIKRSGDWQGRIKERVKELIGDLKSDQVLEGRKKVVS